MRYPSLALTIAVALAAAPAVSAQHPADTGSHDHHAMMARHHSVSMVDLLISHRDSLNLTDDQLKQLADLREYFVQVTGHEMHGAMGTGTMMDQGMAMEHPMTGRAHIAFDRVPGKMVPRVHRTPAKHCPMCPFAILTGFQRERAHELLGQHQGHQHQG